MNQTFRFKEGAFTELRKSVLLKTLPLALACTAMGLGIAYYTDALSQDAAMVLPLFAVIMLIALAVGMHRGVQGLKRMIRSYELTITESSIVREQDDVPSMRIPIDEIVTIELKANGAIMVTGSSSSQQIGIPIQIERKDELLTALEEIRPVVSSGKSSFFEKHPILIGFAILPCMAVLFISESKLLVALGGIVLTSVLGYSMYVLHHSPGVERKAKRRSIWAIGLIIVVICRVIFVLMGIA